MYILSSNDADNELMITEAVLTVFHVKFNMFCVLIKHQTQLI